MGDFEGIKREVAKLANLDYLKKEVQRLKKEIDKIEFQKSLRNKASQSVAQIEKRLRKLQGTLKDLRTEVEGSLNNLRDFVDQARQKAEKKGGTGSKKKSKKKATQTATKKKSAKKQTKKKTKTTRRSVKS